MSLKQTGLLAILALFSSLTLAAFCDTQPKTQADCNTDSKKTQYGWSLHIDQDLFMPARNEDRDYTMGMAFEIFAREKTSNDAARLLSKVHDVLADWSHPLKIVSSLRSARHSEKIESSAKSYLIGLTAYTPDDLSSANPVRNDRPYSSILYYSDKRVASYSRHALSSELRIGILGLNITNQVQTWLHQRFRATFGGTTPVDPKGWENQISDGGELTTLFRLSAATELVSKNLCNCFDWNIDGDISWDSGLSLGYQTNANIGFSTRLGKIDSKPWTLPYDPVNRGNFIPSTSNDELYVWGAYRARFIAYDALLQGQFRHSEYTIKSSNIKRLVHESGIGITGSWKALAITFSLNMKTGEIKGEADRTHVWGGLSINYRYD